MPIKLLFSMGVSIFIHVLLLQFSLSPGASSGIPLAGEHLSVVLRGAEQVPVVDQDLPATDTLLPDAGLPNQTVALTTSSPSSAQGPDSGEVLASLPNPQTPEILMLPLPLPQTTYFRRAELTTSPELLEEPVIDLAEVPGLPAKNIGKLKLRLYINTYGEVDRGEIESASSNSSSDSVAMAVFLGLRFRPGEIKGVPVNSQLVFEVDFDSLAIGASRSTGHSQILHDSPRH